MARNCAYEIGSLIGNMFQLIVCEHTDQMRVGLVCECAYTYVTTRSVA